MRWIVMVTLNDDKLIVRHTGINRPRVVKDLLHIGCGAGVTVVVTAAKNGIRCLRVACRHHLLKNLKIIYRNITALKVRSRNYGCVCVALYRRRRQRKYTCRNNRKRHQKNKKERHSLFQFHVINLLIIMLSEQGKVRKTHK